MDILNAILATLYGLWLYILGFLQLFPARVQILIGVVVIVILLFVFYSFSRGKSNY